MDQIPEIHNGLSSTIKHNIISFNTYKCSHFESWIGIRKLTNLYFL